MSGLDKLGRILYEKYGEAVEVLLDVDGYRIIRWDVADPLPTDLEQYVIDNQQLYDTYVYNTESRAALVIRDAKLSATDWTQLPDAELAPDVLQAYVDYRRALRRIQEQEGFPFNILWPVDPGTQGV